MRKIVLALIVALMGTVAMNAQPPRSAAMLKGRIDQLEKVLNLHPDQKTKITEVMKDEMARLEKERAEAKAEGSDKMSFRSGAREAFAVIDAKIEPLLSPEQLEKYKEFRAQEQKMGQEGSRGHGHKGRHPGANRPKQMSDDKGCCNNEAPKDSPKDCCNQPKGDDKPKQGIE